MGITQHLTRAFLREFPCILSQGVSHLKSLAGERKWVCGKHMDSKLETACTLGFLYLCHFVPPRFYTTWTSCQLDFMSFGLYATWVQLGTCAVLVGRLSLLLGLMIIGLVFFLPLGLHAICVQSGPLQYCLAADKILGLPYECSFKIMKLQIQVLFVCFYFVWGLSMFMVLSL